MTRADFDMPELSDRCEAIGTSAHSATTRLPTFALMICADKKHRTKKWAPVFGSIRCASKKHRTKKWAPVFGSIRCADKNLAHHAESGFFCDALFYGPVAFGKGREAGFQLDMLDKYARTARASHDGVMRDGAAMAAGGAKEKHCYADI